MRAATDEIRLVRRDNNGPAIGVGGITIVKESDSGAALIYTTRSGGTTIPQSSLTSDQDGYVVQPGGAAAFVDLDDYLVQAPGSRAIHWDVTGGAVASVNGKVGDVKVPAGSYRPTEFDPLAGSDPTYNSTAAFQSMRDAYKAARASDAAAAGSGFKRHTGVLDLGPGVFLITSPGALMDDNGDASNNGTFGYEVRGQGEATTIIYRPSSAGPLFRNLNQYLFPKVRDVRFVGFPLGDTNRARAICSYVGSNGVAQGWYWEDCEWWGAWGDLHQLDGFGGAANGNDSWHFLRPRLESASSEGAFFHSGLTAALTNQDQAVAHQIVSPNLHFERNGDIIRLDYGGNVNVEGGSMIIDGSGSGTYGGGRCFYMPANNPHNQGVQRLLVKGTRFEIREATGKICESNWLYGTIDWDSIEADGYPFVDPNQILFSYDGRGYAGPVVNYRGGVLVGRSEGKYRAAGQFGGQAKANFYGVQFLDKADLTSYWVHTDADSGFQKGTGWVANFDDGCWCGPGYGAGQQGKVSGGVAAGWWTQMGGIGRMFSVSAKDVFGTLPKDPGTPGTIPLILPLGALLLGVRFRMPAKPGGSTSTTWYYAITDADANTLATFGPGDGSGAVPATAWNVGWDWYVDVGTRQLWTDNSRKLTITAHNVNDEWDQAGILFDLLPAT